MVTNTQLAFDRTLLLPDRENLVKTFKKMLKKTTDTIDDDYITVIQITTGFIYQNGVWYTPVHILHVTTITDEMKNESAFVHSAFGSEE
jgi:hypothetical protein